MEFFQNADGQLVIWAAIGVLVVLGILVINNKMRRVAIFGVHGVLGIAAVFVINLTMGGFGLAVGINALTMAVAAILGIPGVIMLYGLTFIL
ncbi:MAG: pro-sigmaK processing inhibitor BofA family protein [Defluviitaleaceae bacterium]|nr:pro-sigmaK processing inhibitor BofA family protein [Defluviitaleaceae bacterium]